jgi:hypothetical protein
MSPPITSTRASYTFGRVQELLPQHLGAVDVGGVVEAEGIIALRLLFALEQSQSVLLGRDLEVVE